VYVSTPIYNLFFGLSVAEVGVDEVRIRNDLRLVHVPTGDIVRVEWANRRPPWYLFRGSRPYQSAVIMLRDGSEIEVLATRYMPSLWKGQMTAQRFDDAFDKASRLCSALDLPAPINNTT